MASEKMIKERPETLRKFVRAYAKAQQAAIADPAIAAASVKAVAPETDLAIAEGQWRASIPLMVNDVSKQAGMGKFEPALLAEHLDLGGKVARHPGLTRSRRTAWSTAASCRDAWRRSSRSTRSAMPSPRHLTARRSPPSTASTFDIGRHEFVAVSGAVGLRQVDPAAADGRPDPAERADGSKHLR